MRYLKINEKDNVAIAIAPLEREECIDVLGTQIELVDHIDRFQKFALEPISSGDAIIKYGVSIGVSTKDIHPGESVHVHNMKSEYIQTYSRKKPGRRPTPKAGMQ